LVKAGPVEQICKFAPSPLIALLPRIGLDRTARKLGLAIWFKFRVVDEGRLGLTIPQALVGPVVAGLETLRRSTTALTTFRTPNSTQTVEQRAQQDLETLVAVRQETSGVVT
jgi:hypothetical protein